MKNIRIFHLKIFIFLVVIFSVYLNRHVFVMRTVFFILSIWTDKPFANSVDSYLTSSNAASDLGLDYFHLI